MDILQAQLWHMVQNLGPGRYFMIPITFSQKATPFSWKEHFPGSKQREMATFKKISKEKISKWVNELYLTTQPHMLLNEQ